MIEYLQRIEVIELGHFVFSRPFFPPIVDPLLFPLALQVSEGRALEEKCTCMLKKKKKKAMAVAMTTVSWVGSFHQVEPLEPVHLRNMFQKENLRSFLKNDV